MFGFVKLIFKISLTIIMTVAYPLVLVVVIAAEKDANSFKKVFQFTNDFYKDEFADLWS